MECIKPSDARFIYRSFRTTGNNNIRFTQANKIKRINKTVGGRSTCRYGSKIGSTKPMPDRNMARSNISNYFRDKERIETWSSISLAMLQNLLKEGVYSSN